MDRNGKKESKGTGKALITFGVDFLERMDKHLKKESFRNRSEYISYLVRKDMERTVDNGKDS